MRRREFLSRIAAASGALAFARRARAQGSATDVRGIPLDSVATMPAGPDTLERTKPGIAQLAVGGDTTLGYNLEAHVDEQLAMGVARDSIWPLYFANILPVLDSADLALVNLECPFTSRGDKLSKNFNFRARPELVEILKAGSIDVVTLANNHLKDYGAQGLSDTIATLDAAGIRHFGAGRDLNQARKPVFVEKNGVRFGFLGYYFQADPDMLEPTEVYATRRSAGVAGCYKDLECMKRMLSKDVSKLAPKVDAAIPYFHWGKEGSTEVRDYQIELAHLAVDLGCRAVLGAHPHRLQGVEVYRGAPIFYSLGNFVFGGNKDPQDKLSAIARLNVPRSGTIEAELIPIQITRWPEAPFQPFVLAGDEKRAALEHVAGLSRGFPATLPQLAEILAHPEAVPTLPAARDTSGSGWR